MITPKQKELASKILFFLLPYPLTKALPKSLLVQYYGPSRPEDSPFQPYIPSGNLPPGDTYIPGPHGWIPSRIANPTEQQWESGSIYGHYYWDPLEQWNWIGKECNQTFAFGIALWPDGSWTTDFRPTHFRLKYTWTGAGNLDLYLYDQDAPPNFIIEELNYQSEAEIQIAWAGHDIERIEFVGNGTLTIHKIQFASP